jgi:hypothetical protein
MLELSRVRAVLAGGGWLNRADEALPFVEHALDMAGGPWRVLLVPTPEDLHHNPRLETDPLQAKLDRISGLEFSDVGRDGIWPTADQLSQAIAWANVILIHGGNFAEHMVQLRPSAELLREKFLSGDAVFAGSSAGTVSWFHKGFTADLPLSEGGGVGFRYRPLAGIDALPGLACAHYNERHAVTGTPRSQPFQEYLATLPAGHFGLGIDTPAAAILDGGCLRAVTLHPYSHIQHISVGRSINPLRGDRLRVRSIRPGEPPIPFTDLYAPPPGLTHPHSG